MKITAVETIRLREGIRVHAGPIGWMWVRLHTDEGLVGLGETYPHPASEQAVVLERLAPKLVGRDALAREQIWADLFLEVSYSGWAGAEMRAISAVDLALWDLAGQAANLPLHRLLGGPCREWIPVYNTCYDHLDFLSQPVELAASLLDSGIRAMKIWPFDPIAKETGGQTISAAQMKQGLAGLEAIRARFGDAMDVAMEFHGYWNLPCAIEIARALEPLRPMWLEEMLPQDNMEAYARLAAATRLPLCLSERLMTHWQYRELLELGAASIVMPDLAWCGGITAARKIAALAETCYLPVAPHNCGGPVLHWASAHFAAAIPNLKILETVRRHYLDEYSGLLDTMLVPKDGRLPLPGGRGLGVRLNEERLGRQDAEIRRFPA
ncbi:MAG: mandelate racemase/muconate lactonizing enzyme family protein [Bryobacteraceae bacterium]|nr:mandelate racemase/muconate lactonizing enzyme family protein [Bryobacteraceae bacterium]